MLISKSRVSNSQKELPLAIKLFQETVQAATKGESKSQRQMLIIAYRASTDSPFGAITPTIEVELSKEYLPPGPTKATEGLPSWCANFVS